MQRRNLRSAEVWRSEGKSVLRKRNWANFMPYLNSHLRATRTLSWPSPRHGFCSQSSIQQNTLPHPGVLCWIRVLSGSDRNRIEISSVITSLWSQQAMLPLFIAFHCRILWQVSETGKSHALNFCPLPEPRPPSWNFKNMSQVDSFKHSETWNLPPSASSHSGALFKQMDEEFS